jgi:hypothetical protein
MFEDHSKRVHAQRKREKTHKIIDQINEYENDNGNSN